MKRRLVIILTVLVLLLIGGSIWTLASFAIASMEDAPTYFLRDLRSSRQPSELPAVVWTTPHTTRIIGYASAKRLGVPCESCDFTKQWDDFGWLIWDDSQRGVQAVLPPWSEVEVSPAALTEDDRVLIIEDARGAPYRMWRSRTIIHCAQTGWSAEITNGHELPALPRMKTHPWLDLRVLPREFVLSGFIANVALRAGKLAIGAGIFWAIIGACVASARARRRNRDLCTNCAYDLRGSRGGAEATVCPECGATMNRIAP